jgi:hypothetical protein
MDLYKRVLEEFSQVVADLTLVQYQWICIPEAEDEDTRSIQAIVQHVVRSGNGYTNLMREALGLPGLELQSSSWTPKQGVLDLLRVIEATTQTFDGRWEMPEVDMETNLIQSQWGPIFNLEQLFEHAIVHVLRHQRQVQRYLLSCFPDADQKLPPASVPAENVQSLRPGPSSP